MSFLSNVTGILLGRSAYQPPVNANATISEADQAEMRRALGGQMQLPSQTITRWYLDMLEIAEWSADAGNLRMAGKLMAAARRDGVVSGVLSTRTSGLVRLPRRFRGDTDVVEALSVGYSSVRSVFDEMFPPAELALIAADGELLGVGIGELVPVAGRDYPVLTRLDPQYLQYVWNENQWYYLSAIGRLAIVPGDGRWILHTPGGRYAPWQNGLWRSIGRAYIRKDHALQAKDNWEQKLANPARVAYAPAGSTEAQKDSFFKMILAWGYNSVFGLPLGYEVKLLESNGRGYECFVQTIADTNTEIIISIAGQTITTSGGTGFSNQDIHRAIRADLIKSTADGLAYTINTQGIPAFIALRYGPEAVLTKPCVMEWDVTPPKDRQAEASGMVTVANAVKSITESLAPTETLQLNTRQMLDQFAIPYRMIPPKLVAVGGTAGGADPAASGKPAQDTALNGAQVASLLEVAQACGAGLIPRDAAIGILKRAFLVNDAEAAELLGSIGTPAFTPASATTSAGPAAPAPNLPAPAVPAQEAA